jgi:hypothetical protein
MVGGPQEDEHRKGGQVEPVAEARKGTGTNKSGQRMVR